MNNQGNRPFNFQNIPQSRPKGGGGNRTMFDGKRMRKPIVRKYIDYSNTIMISQDHDIYQTTQKNNFDYVPPHPAFHHVKMLTSTKSKNNPSNFVTTKYVHASINKNRCPINVVTWTPEGRRLITGASTGEFTLWNGFAFNFETIQQAHDGPIRSMQWTHNEKYMISSDNKGWIKYWQPNMNNLKAFIGHPECIRDLSFSPNDSKFASCSDDACIKIWDFKTVKDIRQLEGHGTDVRCCDWHPTSSLVGSGGKDFLTKLWDARSGKHVTDLHGHSNTVVRVKWNRNGNWILTSARDRNIKVYDIRFMKDFQTFKGHPREITSIDWHPVIETLFASGGYDGALFFWSVGRRECIGKSPNAHESSIWDLKWHPLGHILCTGSNDQSTKFWVRNKPGDSMRDRYNIDQMPEGTEMEMSKKRKMLLELQQQQQMSGEGGGRMMQGGNDMFMSHNNNHRNMNFNNNNNNNNNMMMNRSYGRSFNNNRNNFNHQRNFNNRNHNHQRGRRDYRRNYSNS